MQHARTRKIRACTLEPRFFSTHAMNGASAPDRSGQQVGKKEVDVFTEKPSAQQPTCVPSYRHTEPLFIRRMHTEVYTTRHAQSTTNQGLLWVKIDPSFLSCTSLRPPQAFGGYPLQLDKKEGNSGRPQRRPEVRRATLTGRKAVGANVRRSCLPNLIIHLQQFKHHRIINLPPYLCTLYARDAFIHQDRQPGSWNTTETSRFRPLPFVGIRLALLGTPIPLRGPACIINVSGVTGEASWAAKVQYSGWNR